MRPAFDTIVDTRHVRRLQALGEQVGVSNGHRAVQRAVDEQNGRIVRIDVSHRRGFEISSRIIGVARVQKLLGTVACCTTYRARLPARKAPARSAAGRILVPLDLLSPSLRAKYCNEDTDGYLRAFGAIPRAFPQRHPPPCGMPRPGAAAAGCRSKMAFDLPIRWPAKAARSKAGRGNARSGHAAHDVLG